jgi:hypothetical protein
MVINGKIIIYTVIAYPITVCDRTIFHVFEEDIKNKMVLLLFANRSMAMCTNATFLQRINESLSAIPLMRNQAAQTNRCDADKHEYARIDTKG